MTRREDDFYCLVCHFFFYSHHVLMSPVIFYLVEARQHGIYLFNRILFHFPHCPSKREVYYRDSNNICIFHLHFTWSTQENVRFYSFLFFFSKQVFLHLKWFSFKHQCKEPSSHGKNHGKKYHFKRQSVLEWKLSLRLPENVDMQLLIIRWSKYAFHVSTRMLPVKENTVRISNGQCKLPFPSSK